MSHERLVKGAEILGNLWRSGNRCGAAWSVLCVCPTVKSFCLGKKKWLGLLRELHGGKYPHGLSGSEGFLVLECMDKEMLDATRLTFVKVAPPGRALLRIYNVENAFGEALKSSETMANVREEATGPILLLQELWTPAEIPSEASVS